MELEKYEKEHLELLRKNLPECTVLLKKDDRFPLDRPCRLAAFGGGIRNTRKGGTGSGEVNSRFFVTIEEALKQSGFEILSGDWLDAYENEKKKAKAEFIKDLKQRAKKEKVNVVLLGMGAVIPEPEYNLPLDYPTDTAVYVLSRVAGEGNDRGAVAGDFHLTETEIRDINYLNSHYDKFMLVLNVGDVVDLSKVKDVKNILVLSQLGVETGYALTDILLGKTYPSGKLSSTWNDVYNPDADFGNRSDTYYNEGIYVGYRYFNTVGKKPIFPFGYGLSYTDFDIKFTDYELNGSEVKVKCSVKNTGRYPGKEVAQLYVSKPSGKLDQPYMELAAFKKTKELKSGASENITLGFNMKDILSYSEKDSAYILEKGEYVLRLGNSSDSTAPIGVIDLKETQVVRKVKSIAGDPGFEDKKYSCAVNELLPELKHTECTELKAENITYGKITDIPDSVKKLTDEELCLLSIGLFNPKGGILSIIGNASPYVCGAGGDTTDRVTGVNHLTVADGPAGLRITRDYYEDKKGFHQIGVATIPESILDFMPAPLKLLSKLLTGGKSEAPKGVEVKHQYATAIPIAAAISQSWNEEFAGICGDIVGDEMERTKISLWLAPAMNIKRSVLCGRNFEYYSEDPCLTAKLVAAMTKGVQKHPGRGVTIKHFCCNNREYNRTNNNSHVSERALREIYIKAFEMVIKEAAPHALMTSYNLLNGTHTAESESLISDYLRCECGYNGIIMTDWVVKGSSQEKTPKYEQTNSAKVASAGGNLFMPGCREDYDLLLGKLKCGEVKRETLEENASVFIKKVKELTENT